MKAGTTIAVCYMFLTYWYGRGFNFILKLLKFFYLFLEKQLALDMFAYKVKRERENE